MPVWWDDASQFAGQDGRGNGVPEAEPRERWSEWDKMTLGGMEVPGHVVVVSKKEKKADVISVAGQDGATINHLGVEPVELDITVTIWTPQQFLDYSKLVGSIAPKAFVVRDPALEVPVSQVLPFTARDTGPQATASADGNSFSFAVQHPPLNMLGVNDIYIYEIGSLIPGPVYGSKVSIWRAKERKPDQPILIQASSSAPYTAGLHASPAKPAPTQPVAKPSVSAVGP